MTHTVHIRGCDGSPSDPDTLTLCGIREPRADTVREPDFADCPACIEAADRDREAREAAAADWGQDYDDFRRGRSR